MIIKNRKNIDILIFGILFSVITCVLVNKCKYGLAGNDEAFYLTIPYRLSIGDSLFDTEWHLSQLSSVLLLLPVKLFLSINGSTEGILLWFRYLYVAVLGLSAIVIFFCLRTFCKSGSVISVCLFYLYAPFCISALSYNSMGIISLSLALSLLLCTNSKKLTFIAGILYSAAVLCCPYLAILAVLYPIVYRINNRFHFLCEALSKKSNITSFIMGIVISAAAFFVYLLINTDISAMAASIPYILSDPEHAEPFRDKFKVLYYSVVYTGSCRSLYIILTLLLIATVISRNPKVNCFCALTAIFICGIICIIYFFRCRYINFFMFPLNISAFICILSLPDKRMTALFETLWIPGMIYALCIFFSSNNRFYAISSASAVSLLASVIILTNTIFIIWTRTGNKLIKSISLVILVFALSAQAYGEIYSRINDIFADAPRKAQTLQIDKGPEKGIISSFMSYELYNSMLREISLIDTPKVLLLSDFTWIYLCGEWEMCTYSAWLSGVNPHTLDRLEAYYNINSHKIPDTIFIDSIYLQYESRIAELFEYGQRLQTSEGAVILKNCSLK